MLFLWWIKIDFRNQSGLCSQKSFFPIAPCRLLYLLLVTRGITAFHFWRFSGIVHIEDQHLHEWHQYQWHDCSFFTEIPLEVADFQKTKTKRRLQNLFVLSNIYTRKQKLRFLFLKGHKQTFVTITTFVFKIIIYCTTLGKNTTCIKIGVFDFSLNLYCWIALAYKARNQNIQLDFLLSPWY